MITIGILEDDEDMQAYLAQTVAPIADMKIVFAATTLVEALAAIDKSPVDLCLVDIQLPDGNGLDFINKIKQKTQARCLILTVLGDRTSVLQALQIGAHGYLLKDTDGAQIIRDIRATLAGEAPISARAARHLLEEFQTRAPGAVSGQTECVLTERERDLLNLFARGLSYKETACVLNISTHTVNDYVKSIYQKMDVHSKNEAVFEATSQGWLRI